MNRVNQNIHGDLATRLTGDVFPPSEIQPFFRKVTFSRQIGFSAMFSVWVKAFFKSRQLQWMGSAWRGIWEILQPLQLSLGWDAEPCWGVVHLCSP